MTKLTAADFPAQASLLDERARVEFDARIIAATVQVGLTDRAEIVAFAVSYFRKQAAKCRGYAGPKAAADAARYEAAADAIEGAGDEAETYTVTDRAFGLVQWEGIATNEADAMARFDLEVGFFPDGIPADWADHYDVTAGRAE